MKPRALVAAVLLAFAAACSRHPVSGPPDIQVGRRSCSACGMMISEARHAAAARTPEGTVLAYDDLGEFFTAAAAAPSLTRDAWVHDVESEAWVAAKDASYLKVEGLSTPMGGGFAAFSSAERAAAFRGSRPGASVTLDLSAALAAAKPR